jgi:hypothetical protein
LHKGKRTRAYRFSGGNPAFPEGISYFFAGRSELDLPLATLTRMGFAALPFEHPKLAVVASVGDGRGLAAQLEAALKRSGATPISTCTQVCCMRAK